VRGQRQALGVIAANQKNLAKMGAEALPRNDEIAAAAVSSHPLILGLQPAALVDHVAPVDWSLLDQTPGDRGGSMPVLSLSSISLRFNLILDSHCFIGLNFVLSSLFHVQFCTFYKKDCIFS
jgi:hypothetical protein